MQEAHQSMGNLIATGPFSIAIAPGMAVPET